MAYHHSHPLEDLNGKKKIPYQKKINKPKRFLVLLHSANIFHAVCLTTFQFYACNEQLMLQLWQVTSSSYYNQCSGLPSILLTFANGRHAMDCNI